MFKCPYCGFEAQNPDELLSHILEEQKKHVEKIRRREERNLRRLFLIQSASLLTQICLLSHEPPEKVWDTFREFYEKMEGMMVAEEAETWLEEKEE